MLIFIFVNLVRRLKLQFAEHRQENFGHCEAHEGDSHHYYPVLRAVLVDVGGSAEHSDTRDVADGKNKSRV